MAKHPRVQIGKLEREGLQPRARPTDTFVAPNATSGVRLARALGVLGAGVADLGDQLTEKQRAKRREEGKAFGRNFAKSGKTFKDAIREGRITPDQSPFFRLGAEEVFGQNAADQFGLQLQIELASGQLSSSTDPEAFDDRIAQLQSEFIADAFGNQFGGAVERAFAGRLQQHVSNARQSFGAKTGRNLIEQTKRGLYAAQSGNILEWMTGNAERDFSEIGDMLSTQASMLVAAGFDGTDANSLTAQAVVDAALRAGDASLLQILDNVQAGTGKLGNVRGILQLRRETESRIAIQSANQDRADEAEQKRLRKEIIETANQNLLLELFNAADPANVSVDEAALALVNQGLPEASLDLYRVKAQFLSRDDTQGDETTYRDMLANVYLTPDSGDQDFVGYRSIANQLAAGQIDPTEAKALWTEIDRRTRVNSADGENEEWESVYWNFKPAKDAPAEIGRLFAISSRIDISAAQGLEVAYRETLAKQDFANEWLAYMQGEGQSATLGERQEFIQEQVITSARRHLEGVVVGAQVIDAAILEFQGKPAVPGAAPVEPTPLSADEIERMRNEIRNRNLSPESFRRLRDRGVNMSPEDILQFLIDEETKLISQTPDR